MDILDEYVKDNLLSKENILRFVDDYSIYSFYIGAELELRTKYSSPLRVGDNDPSFSIFESKFNDKQIVFKDNMLGISGKVFKFVQHLMSNGELVSMKTVLLQINSDFGIGLGDVEVGEFKPHLIKAAPLKKLPTNIEVTNHKVPTNEYKAYWEVLGISDATLKKYYTTNPRAVHYVAEEHRVMVPRTLTIAYEILGTYKVYHPKEKKKYKFRNNFLETYVEGAMQLEFKQEFCIITKAMKECMWFYEHFRWEAVAGKSETTMIPPHFMNNILRKRYKVTLIWLDGDEAGLKAQARYMEMYPWLVPVVMDSIIEQKDVTDFYTEGRKLNKADMVISYVKQLIIKKLDGNNRN